MEIMEKSTKIKPDNSLSKLRYEASKWFFELDFIALEIPFIKQILKSYPFQSDTPNLFERLQLYVKELETLNETRINILDKITTHRNQLNEIKSNSIFNENYLKINHEIIEDEFVNFLENYKHLKWQIFEYANAVID